MRGKSWTERKGWMVVSAVVMALVLAGGMFAVERAYAKTAKEIECQRRRGLGPLLQGCKRRQRIYQCRQGDAGDAGN